MNGPLSLGFDTAPAGMAARPRWSRRSGPRLRVLRGSRPRGRSRRRSHQDRPAVGVRDLARLPEDHLEQFPVVLLGRQRSRDLEELLQRVFITAMVAASSSTSAIRDRTSTGRDSLKRRISLRLAGEVSQSRREIPGDPQHDPDREHEQRQRQQHALVANLIDPRQQLVTRDHRREKNVRAAPGRHRRHRGEPGPVRQTRS